MTANTSRLEAIPCPLAAVTKGICYVTSAVETASCEAVYHGAGQHQANVASSWPCRSMGGSGMFRNGESPAPLPIEAIHSRPAVHDGITATETIRTDHCRERLLRSAGRTVAPAWIAMPRQSAPYETLL